MCQKIDKLKKKKSKRKSQDDVNGLKSLLTSQIKYIGHGIT